METDALSTPATFRRKTTTAIDTVGFGALPCFVKFKDTFSIRGHVGYRVRWFRRDSLISSFPPEFMPPGKWMNMEMWIISALGSTRRVGKAWKRGYLLYGPPGTGKSSLVAAMANHLKFDVYDLDLREVQCNSDLRRLLIGSANRSILVIEDIDCNVGLQNRGESNNQSPEDDKITLSGLLNFMDGLWSSCGDERIIVFTTNHKDRLDPALLRPGRMDVHVHMSYCTFSGFVTLASNYLKIDHHHHVLYPEIEQLLLKVKATPAEVAGELMKSDDADTALPNLITFLQNKENS